MSNGHRWSKFWWADWQNDKALQSCSLAARGLWIELLGIAHNAEPCGHVLINGKMPTVERLAGMVGRTTPKEVTKLLAELEEADVFSRREDGTIYSRRMVKDAALSESGRDAATKRWTDPKPNGSPNGLPNGLPNGGPNAPEAEEHSDSDIEKDPSRSPPTADAAGGRTPASPGTPPTRASGNNPRATGTNPRATATNPRVRGTNPRDGFVSGGIAVMAKRLLEIAEAKQSSEDDFSDERSYYPGLRIVDGNHG